MITLLPSYIIIYVFDNKINYKNKVVTEITTLIPLYIFVMNLMTFVLSDRQ